MHHIVVMVYGVQEVVRVHVYVPMHSWFVYTVCLYASRHMHPYDCDMSLHTRLHVMHVRNIACKLAYMHLHGCMYDNMDVYNL